MLAGAGEQTVTQFSRALTRAIHAVDPAAAEARHREAKRHDQGLWLRALPDGLAGIWSVHDEVTATAMMEQITTPWNGTNTVETSLHALCRHHHLKHDTDWHAQRLPVAACLVK